MYYNCVKINYGMYKIVFKKVELNNIQCIYVKKWKN